LSAERPDDSEALEKPDEEAQPSPAQPAGTLPDGTPTPQVILDALTTGQPQAVIRAFQASVWSGPIPPAQELEKYNGVIDGGANRVMALVEGQARHRQGLEQQSVDADIWLRKAGLIVAASATLILLVGGIVLIAVGKNIGVLATLVPAVAILAGVFISWKSRGGGGPPAEPQ
jgi:uncharacterized membrane protein